MKLTFTIEQYKFLEKVRIYAYKCHENRNQKYDGKPYSYHLDMVHDFALKYIHLIPEEFRHIVLASARTHDLIEDTGETYNDVKAVCGEVVADITYALTNEKSNFQKKV